MRSRISDEAPWSDALTAYDEVHLTIYLRLLDARSDGASSDEMARIILEIDPVREPERAKRSLESHIRRAEWMTENGYRQLLKD